MDVKYFERHLTTELHESKEKYIHHQKHKTKADWV